jgi:tetratricopeptide (TPR) repeat protein
MRFRTPTLCSFALVAVSTQARADEAQTHIDEGTKHYNVQRYDRAAEEYQAAYLLDPKPDYLYAVAQAQRLAGDCEKSVRSYRAYLRTQPAAEDRAKAETNLARCLDELKRREVTTQAADGEAPNALPPTPAEAPRASPTDDKSYLVGHLLVGAGLVVLGGGAYLYRDGHRTIEAHNSATTYDAFVTTSAGVDDARRRQVLGVSALAAGGGLVISGVVFYIVRARAPETRVSAQVTSEGTMVTLGRSF